MPTQGRSARGKNITEWLKMKVSKVSKIKNNNITKTSLEVLPSKVISLGVSDF